MSKRGKVFDLVGVDLRRRGKRCADLWRRYCRGGLREQARSAFLEAVAYGYVPREIAEELEALSHSVEMSIGVIEQSCLAGLEGAAKRRARLYMASDALAYVLGLVRAQITGGQDFAAALNA